MSTGSTQPFRVSATTTVAATTAPASAALAGAGSGDAALILNATTGIATVSFGAGVADAALGTPVMVPAGQRMLAGVGNLAGAVTVQLSAGSGSVFVMLGNGTVY